MSSTQVFGHKTLQIRNNNLLGSSISTHRALTTCRRKHRQISPGKTEKNANRWLERKPQHATSETPFAPQELSSTDGAILHETTFSPTASARVNDDPPPRETRVHQKFHTSAAQLFILNICKTPNDTQRFGRLKHLHGSPQCTGKSYVLSCALWIHQVSPRNSLPTSRIATLSSSQERYICRDIRLHGNPLPAASKSPMVWSSQEWDHLAVAGGTQIHHEVQDHSFWTICHGKLTPHLEERHVLEFSRVRHLPRQGSWWKKKPFPPRGAPCSQVLKSGSSAQPSATLS